MARIKAPHPNDWYGWERPGTDFPLYKEELPLWNGILLAASSLIICLILQTHLIPLGGRWGTVIFLLLGTLLPFLYVARGNIACLFKKPQKGDFLLIFALLGMYYLYALTMHHLLLTLFNIDAAANPAASEVTSVWFWVALVIQLFGEEMVKINIFLGLLMVIYQLTHNRKLGIIVGTVLCLIFFGLAHLPAYGSIMHCLFIIGAGSIFHLYGYLKTKNVLIGYAVHIMTDSLIFLFILLLKSYGLM